MDFTKQDSRAAAEKPQFCHLRYPHNGEYIYDEDTGEAVGVMAVGSQSRSLQKKLREQSREALTKNEDKDEDEAWIQAAHELMMEAAKNVTVGFVNIQRCEVDENGEVILNKNGEPKNKWDATAPDDSAWFYDLNFVSVKALKEEDKWHGQSFSQQVAKFTSDIGNYLGNG